MKKNVMMRIASGLLVAVLLSTCAISGTFAKYVTSGSATDTARVAKFGVTITGQVAEGKADFFDAAYNDADTIYDGLSVYAAENVVAPGTSRDNLIALSVTGTPEVAVRVSYENTVVDFGDNWSVGGAYYCPIVVTVGSTTIKGMTYSSIGDFENAIEAAIVGCTKDYAPGDDLSAVNDDVVIGWSWPFEGGDGQDNAKDTILGNAYNATISIKVDATITQID